jgi:hypothetical protein
MHKSVTAEGLRSRRERLRLSREQLARITEPPCSAASIELFEGGWRPRRSRVLPAVFAALARVEAERELDALVAAPEDRKTNERLAANETPVMLGDGTADNATG